MTMADSTKKKNRTKGDMPNQPGKKTNLNTSADYGTSTIKNFFSPAEKALPKETPAPATQEEVLRWDDSSSESDAPLDSIKTTVSQH